MVKCCRKSWGLCVPFFAAVVWALCWDAGDLRGQDAEGLAAALALERAFEHAIEEAEASVVSIARIKHAPQRNTFEERANAPFLPDPLEMVENPDNPDFIPTDFGAGIILPNDGPPEKRGRSGYILTNYHVVKGAPIHPKGEPRDIRLHVRLADRRGFDAEIYAADPRSDLAILVIRDVVNLKPIKFANPAQPVKKGQLVLALGNPYAIARDGSASASWGMISNTSRRPEYIGPRAAHGHTPLEETIHHLGTLLQVDTRLNLGMSGGALVNLRGELVGITTSMAALLGYEKSVGYAIPIDAGTMRIINTLREGKEVEYGFLGVSIGPLVDRRELRQFQPRPRPINGVHIDVLPNSPAARAGLMNNDYITAVNDVPIHDRVDLTREVGKLPPGAKVELRVARASATEPVKLSVELGKWPVVDDEGIIAPQRSAEAWRGLIVDYPTARLKYYTDVTRYPTGVLVTDVLPASRGAGADLVPGNYIYRVNGEPVSKPADFYAMVRGNKGDVVLDLADEPKENRRVVIRADSP